VAATFLADEAAFFGVLILPNAAAASEGEIPLLFFMPPIISV
jgi:hypothetical protein